MDKIEIKLYELMAKKNIRKIEDLHEMTGLSRTVISEILSGKRQQIRLVTVAKLCKVLDCEVGDLIKIRREGA